MLYKRNVPNWERILRSLLGVGLITAGLFVFKTTPLGIGLAVCGVVALATGSVGYCPPCVVAGRKPVETSRAERRS